MKKLVFIVFAGLFSSLVMAATAKFEGTVTVQTWAVTVNGQSGATIITLPVVSTTDFPRNFDPVGLTEFSIEVSQCSYQGSHVSPRFVANNMYPTGALGNLSGPGYAQNVIVRIGATPEFFLYLQDQTMVPKYSTPLQGTGSNRYGSRVYYAAVGPVMPGKVQASLQYAIVYP